MKRHLNTKSSILTFWRPSGPIHQWKGLDGCALWACFVCAASLVTSVVAAEVPRLDFAEVQQFVQREALKREAVGMVVGVIDGDRQEIISYGAVSKEDSRKPDRNTIYEIGSITKAFTGVLLGEMAEAGEVNLSDPVSKYLPAEVRMPARAGREITLGHLANHTSAIPRLPSNMKPKDPMNPYADYTVAMMYSFFSDLELKRDIGSEYEYSNVAFGLLGHVLGRQAGMSYPQLVLKRVCLPLGMTNTDCVFSPSMKEHLAPGYNREGRQVPNWDLNEVAAGGGLRSSMSDMLKFLEANLRPAQSKISRGLWRSHNARSRAENGKGPEMGLGWHIDGDTIWHNGETGGYHSYMGFNPKTQRGVVILCNRAANIDPIGVRILENRLASPKAVTIDVTTLDRYTGRYELKPDFILTVTRQGENLFVQATGQSRLSMTPTAVNRFAINDVEASISFHSDDNGQVKRLTLHQNGNHEARRIQ